MVPTYNEAPNIRPILDALLGLGAPIGILVVDDDSPDGTGRIVREHYADQPQVDLVVRKEKPGRGLAAAAGYAHFLEGPYRYLVELDADFQEEPKDVLMLLEAAVREDAHVVIGSRYVPQGGFTSHKKWLSLLARWASQLVFRTSVKDLTCTFHLVRRDVFEAVPCSSLRSEGFFFASELHLRAERAGLKVIEVPYYFSERRGEKSTVRLGEVRRFAGEALRFLLRA